MAKAVTLKNSNNEEVYPVTDLSLVNGNIPTGRIADNAITTPKIANGAVTQDKISGGWKLIGEANGSDRTNLPLYLNKIYKTGTFKVIASGQCNEESWVDLRAYYGTKVGESNLIHTSYAMVNFAGNSSNASSSDANNANFIAAGTDKAYTAFSVEATSSNSGNNWRTWIFQFGCGIWGRIGTARESNSYNKTAFSLDSAKPMFDAHIEVWWHE